MIKRLILKLIRLYQASPWFHSRIFRFFLLTDGLCRFVPRCSEYGYQAIEKYGIFRGSWLGLRRIIRCHPWSKGGPDPLN